AGLHRQHRARRGDRRERAGAADLRGRHRGRGARRVRARAGGQSQARQARPPGQGGAAAAYGLGHARRPHRHGREGDRQHQDFPGRAQASRPRPAVDAVSVAAVRHDFMYRGANPGRAAMRALLVAGVAVVAVTASALAADFAQNEIKTTFFTGQPFTASATNVKFKMTSTPDGKMTREPIGAAGAKAEGTWKLTKDGFCTTWQGAKQNCYRLMTAGDNKWSVMKGTTALAT